MKAKQYKTRYNKTSHNPSYLGCTKHFITICFCNHSAVHKLRIFLWPIHVFFLHSYLIFNLFPFLSPDLLFFTIWLSHSIYVCLILYMYACRILTNVNFAFNLFFSGYYSLLKHHSLLLLFLFLLHP